MTTDKGAQKSRQAALPFGLWAFGAACLFMISTLTYYVWTFLTKI